MNLEKQINEEIKKIPINWKFKLAGSLFSFGLGIGLGAIGKQNGREYVPAIPLLIDITGGMTNIKTYFIYGTGVAMNYIPEICQLFSKS